VLSWFFAAPSLFVPACMPDDRHSCVLVLVGMMERQERRETASGAGRGEGGRGKGGKGCVKERVSKRNRGSRKESVPSVRPNTFIYLTD